jgi:hypothetical protein
MTSVRSPEVSLGAAGSNGWTLAFRYTFAHNAKSNATDRLRVSVDGTTVFELAATGTNRNASWTAATVSLDAFAGQQIRVLFEAVDGAADSLVEAAIDDVRIYRAP